MEAVRFLIFLLLFKGAFAKLTNHSSQDILQSNETGKRETVKVTESKSEERCDLEPENPIDIQFRSYMDKFANSESGKFLKDLISKKSVSKLSKPITNLLENVDKEHVEGLNQIPKEPYDKTWNFVSLGVSALYAIVLGYFTIFSPLSTYTTMAISSFVLCSIVIGLCHDLVPLWMAALVSFVGDLIVFILLTFLDNIKRRQIGVLSVCMVFSKMVYDVHAVVPLEYVSPSFTGISGILVNYVFRSNSFIFLRLTYLFCLILLTCTLFIRLPTYVAGEPMELEEIDSGATIMKKLICFVSSLPAAGFCTQVYSGLRKTPNPLGPFTFFIIPTKFRLNELESYMSITFWAVFGVVYYSLIKHSTENNLTTHPKKRRSWRAYTRTISRI
ncbi:putative integral membrane protein [Theileria parva strain Muguga]|uniref:Uncharacterized protein n=1 Tax=Theileria parva TaxID=5875 RepID=Q4N0X3_THEPA|nr:putative integral membrane protein [Theileria parva strain Muguga]EAN31192.1 putative integral membrane protein [Theileria parva strain Muguga]|eukprot:XP_763475.1 hypothetical protein [Theileria parva strain Muguga]